MSLMVIGYQIIIYCIVYFSGGNKLVTAAAVVWTLLHIFAPWLMVVQLCVIALAYLNATDKK